MRERILKNQIAVFGRFNFPPVPDVTVALLQAFAVFGFMPTVIHQIDANGQMQPKISLTKPDEQIIFSNDRIDFLQNLPSGDGDLTRFLEEVIQYIACLQSRNLQFNRLAVVTERLLQDLSTDQKEAVRERFAPGAPFGSIEWGFRWVKPQDEQGELMNVSFDIARLSGVYQEGSRIEQFDGLKVLHDISTSPHNVVFRYNSANVSSGLQAVKQVIDRQIAAHEIGGN